jgi:DNA-binding CsgD family transcriptional regulator
MHPVNFLFNPADPVSGFWLYSVYIALLCLTIVIVAVNRVRVIAVLFSHGVVMFLAGILGFIGAVFIVRCDFSSPFSTLLVMTGISFTALYTPIHFMFWGAQLCKTSRNAVVFDALVSYVLFCLICVVRLFFGIHESSFAVAFPLIAAVLSFFSAHDSQKYYSQRGQTLRALPFRIIIPSMLFVYLCGVIVALSSPTEALSVYPPNRALLYLINALLFSLIALVFTGRLGNGKIAIKTFTLLSVYLVGALIVTAFAAIGWLQVGNFPLIAGKIAFEFFIWLLIIIKSQSKHIGSVLPVSLFLLIVVALPNFFTACLLQQVDVFAVSPDSFTLLITMLVFAFAISAIANAVLIYFLTRTAPQNRADSSDVHLEEAYNKAQSALGLSKREREIMTFACQNMSSLKIGENLFIAESTVNTHLKRIYRKAGVHSKQELIDLAKKFGASK